MAILDLSIYKSYKSITNTKDDTKHTLIINAVNTFIEGYCGRVFTTYFSTNTKTEYFDADTTEIYPAEYPIVGVTSLKYSTDAGETYSETLEEYTDYIILTDSVIALGTEFASPTYPINALELIYNGGLVQYQMT